jgi:hypothetical protein
MNRTIIPYKKLHQGGKLKCIIPKNLRASLERPKKYENGHKNIYGFFVVLEMKVENSIILTFKAILLCLK